MTNWKAYWASKKGQRKKLRAQAKREWEKSIGSVHAERWKQREIMRGKVRRGEI